MTVLINQALSMVPLTIHKPLLFKLCSPKKWWKQLTGNKETFVAANEKKKGINFVGLQWSNR